jgi:hypothetical protein
MQVTFVGPGFTRKPPKYERFIRPTGLRMNKAHVTHPELKATFCLDILGVKKNPNGPMYSSMGVMTKARGAWLGAQAWLRHGRAWLGMRPAPRLPPPLPSCHAHARVILTRWPPPLHPPSPRAPSSRST